MAVATLSHILDLIGSMAKRRKRVMFSGPQAMRTVHSRNREGRRDGAVEQPRIDKHPQ
jgi:hypothetical protein